MSVIVVVSSFTYIDASVLNYTKLLKLEFNGTHLKALLLLIFFMDLNSAASFWKLPAFVGRLLTAEVVVVLLMLIKNVTNLLLL